MRLFKIYIRFFLRRIMLLLYLLFFVALYFILDLEHFNVFWGKIANPFYDFFSAQSRFFYVIIIIIIFAFTTTIVEIILAIVFSKLQDKRIKRTSRIDSDINSRIFQHLYDTNDIDADIYYIQEHKRLYTSDYPQLIFINRLRRISLLTKGNVNAHCIRLFHLLNSEDLIRTYLKSPNLRHKLLAIRIIGDFRLKVFLPELKKLIRHKKAIIASEAMYAYVKTETNTDFLFLMERNKTISKLDMFNFYQIAKNYKQINYKALITSSLPSISALGLHFAAMHNVTSVKAEIFKRINHIDPLVSHEAQSAYLEMIEDYDAAILLNLFDAFDHENQLKILNLLGDYLDNPLVLSMFSNIIEQFGYELKTAAMQILMQHNISATLKFRNHSNPMIQKAYNELTDF